jgi:hypothetical protein
MSSYLRLVLVPGLITFGVTILRLVGELNGWSRALFNPDAGGGGALVGIAWLVPVFGIYFALKLSQSGQAPGGGKTLLHGVLGLAAYFAIVFGLGAVLGLDFNQPTLAALAVIVIASIVGLALAYQGSGALGKVLVAYGLAARIPVILVMLVAMLGNWGTHYDVAPPGVPEMGVFQKWVLLGVVPQLTVWMAFTVVLGALFGGIALVVAERRRKSALRTA